MNYEEAVAYIEDIPKFTKKNKLSHTRDFLERLGNPDRLFDVIHVAGSNGKGSVCAFTASVLAEAGYKVGLFTSPHLMKINERFRIGGEDIPDEVFLQAFDEIYDLTMIMVKEGEYHPTYFEFLFLMAMIIFAGAGIQVAVLETGLGGRMDLTNVVQHPLACVITSISLEHTEYLGNTLTEIAGEKAGIIKPRAAVIYEAFKPEVSRVIEDAAVRAGDVTLPLEPKMYEILRNTGTAIDFSLKNKYYDSTVFTIPFVAPYQVINASLALLALYAVRESYPVDIQTLQRGMALTDWQGRMETILPGVIIDGAHNEDGIRRFVETAKQFDGKQKITFLFSAVVEKDYRAMIHEICSSLDLCRVITTQIDGDRVVAANELAEIFRENGCRDVKAVARVEDAFAEAYGVKGDGVLFCVGSLYLIGEIKAYLNNKEKYR